MMKNTFADYIKEPYALEFDQMKMLHEDLLSEIDDDPDTIELYEELIDAATKYAAIRAKWGANDTRRKNGYRFFTDVTS